MGSQTYLESVLEARIFGFISDAAFLCHKMGDSIIKHQIHPENRNLKFPEIFFLEDQQ